MPDTEYPEGTATATEGQGPERTTEAQPKGQGEVTDLDWSKVPFHLPEEVREAVQDQYRENVKLKDAKFTKELQELSALRKKYEGAENAQKAVAALTDRLKELEQQNPKLFGIVTSALDPSYQDYDVEDRRLRQRAESVKTVPDVLKVVRDMVKESVQEAVTPYVRSYQQEQMQAKLVQAMQSLPQDLRGRSQEVLTFWAQNPNMAPEEAVYAKLGPELARRASVATSTRSESNPIEESLMNRRRPKNVLDALREARRQMGQ